MVGAGHYTPSVHPDQIPTPTEARSTPDRAKSPRVSRREVMDLVQRFWGFDALRPIQEDAIRAALQGRDSLVVMPTGGGKSLCYQVPPLATGRLAVVASPLISLMKDQVDGLEIAGYPAAALHSGLDADESRRIESRLMSGEIKLLFLAPERLLTPWAMDRLKRLDVGAFAIDEAHCISQWGHDFRPEYRRLAELRNHFPSASFHAFTATATERVREDIIQQLRLRDPAVLVGIFDRPNLTYRILPRVRLDQQVAEAIGRHASGESAGATIVYCISRKDTEALAATLTARGIAAAAYHAGLTPVKRERVQNNFSQERLDVVVATVAFGMGIDRSNVRCVIHAAMPKSVEAYQQETGRAGRDGLPAECLLLYSAADAVRWQELMRRSADESGASEESLRAQLELLERMHRFCSGAACRHKALSEYFGQEYTPPAVEPGAEGAPTAARGCAACDVCLGDLETVDDSTTIARKILSCVVRVGQAFGAAHVADVLRGANTQKIRDRSHDKLSTFGLLRGVDRPALLGYINQLIDQGVLARSPGEYPVLVLTEESAAVLRGTREVTLLEPKRELARAEPRSAGPRASRGDDRPLGAEEVQLFESLRQLRIFVARERNVPPFIVFSDTTLRDMARLRPRSVEAMAGVRGVGQKKLADLAPRFAAHIDEHCRGHALESAPAPAATAYEEPARGPRGEATGSRGRYFELFRKNVPLEAAAEEVGHKVTTACGYLAEFIIETKPASVEPWVDAATYELISTTATQIAADRFKPIFDHLGGRVSYEQIRIVMTHLRVLQEG